MCFRLPRLCHDPPGHLHRGTRADLWGLGAADGARSDGCSGHSLGRVRRDRHRTDESKGGSFLLLLVTSATLVVTGALLVVTKKLLELILRHLLLLARHL